MCIPLLLPGKAQKEQKKNPFSEESEAESAMEVENEPASTVGKPAPVSNKVDNNPASTVNELATSEKAVPTHENPVSNENAAEVTMKVERQIG